mmetsp:Transcript_93254/g.301479  ORF Transcript_93254/g.301479 Transcript_93254/m.301479 type:complete len:269 (-) Transcript_93254:812-1618(-)
MAACASWASFTVCSFSAFSLLRSSVWVATSMSLSDNCTLASVISLESSAMELLRPSISLESRSTSEERAVRTCSLEASSVSHHPLCWASSVASSWRRTMRSWIIFFTFSKGSSCTRVASAESRRLLIISALVLRYSTARSCAGLWPAVRSCSSAGAPARRPCTNEVPKYLLEVPETLSPERISSACSMAEISSARRRWRSWKSASFCVHVAVVVARIFWSSVRVVVVSCRSAFIVAADCRLWALRCALEEMLSSAVATDFFRSWSSSS